MKRKITKAILVTFCSAAVASAAISSAFADHRRNHHPPGHSKRDYRHDDGERGGPPAWAPAWGYRGKHKIRYKRAGRVYEAGPADLVRVPEMGPGRCNRDVIGAILGGAVGAAAGSQIGKGDGRTLATIGGAIIGVLVGGNIGRAMDQVDQSCVGQVLERTPNGRTVIWQNPDRRVEYQVTPARTWQTRDGTYCREYQTKIVIDGRLESAHGTACRQPDGTWRKV